MTRDLLRGGEGRFFRGNLHCHSNRSDGQVEPVEVVAAYRDAGYDFIVLSDHFEPDYGWRITDTRDLRSADFTTIVGAELSSAEWDDRDVYFVTAAGLPVDFQPPRDGDRVEAIRRAHEGGAFVLLLHPGLTNMPLAGLGELPGLEAIDAVEVYNHNMAVGSHPDRANGGATLDALLESGRRVFATAGDDAHFDLATDRFGGWVEVHAPAREPEALLASLKAGTYYSTQGPRIERLEHDGDHLHVATSPASAIALGGGGDRWQDASSRAADPGEQITDATFDLGPFEGAYCRVIVTGADGKLAWSNPVWP